MSRAIRIWAPLAGAFLFCAAFATALAPWSPACAAEFETTVARVLDGDTLVLTDGVNVRLIGINTPELGKDSASDQPLARAAHERLAALVAGKRVRVITGPETHDRYGRLLANIAVGGEPVEEALLRDGLAWMVAIPPNVAHVERFAKAEAQARSRGLGVWREPQLQPVEAAALRTGGFHLVRGRIREVRRGRAYYYFELAPRMVIAIPHDAWREYFAGPFGRPETLTGRQLIARGWVNNKTRELRLRIAHPAMIEWAQPD